MSARLNFKTDGINWPHRDASQFITVCEGQTLHVQVMGEGPALLLLHGTGSATHSWRELMPLLAAHFTCIAPDLPGHGFSSDPGMDGLSLKGMARAMREMLDTLKLEPVWAIGHSAGAALAIRMTLDKQLTPEGIISLNGALMPFGGSLSTFFAPIAKAVATLPMITALFAWRARDPRVLSDMIKQTGSTISAETRAHYQTLAGNAEHVTAAFGMMANWDLPSLERDMKQLGVPLHLVVGLRDAMVKPSVSQEAARIVPNAALVRLAGLGHLAHEEQPGQIADVITHIIACRTSSQPSHTQAAHRISRMQPDAAHLAPSPNKKTTQGRPA